MKNEIKQDVQPWFYFPIFVLVLGNNILKYFTLLQEKKKTYPWQKFMVGLFDTGLELCPLYF